MSGDFRDQITDLEDRVKSTKNSLSGSIIIKDDLTGEGFRVDFDVPDHLCELSDLDVDFSQSYSPKTARIEPINRCRKQGRIRVDEEPLLSFLKGMKELANCEYKNITLIPAPRSRSVGFNTDRNEFLQVLLVGYDTDKFGKAEYFNTESRKLQEFSEFHKNPKNQDLRSIVELDDPDTKYLKYAYIYDSIVIVVSQKKGGTDDETTVTSFYCPDDALILSYIEEHENTSILTDQNSEFKAKLISNTI